MYLRFSDWFESDREFCLWSNQSEPCIGHSHLLVREFTLNYLHQIIDTKLFTSNYLHQIIHIKLFTLNYLHQIIYTKLFTSNYLHQTIYIKLFISNYSHQINYINFFHLFTSNLNYSRPRMWIFNFEIHGCGYHKFHITVLFLSFFSTYPNKIFLILGFYFITYASISAFFFSLQFVDAVDLWITICGFSLYNLWMYNIQNM